MAIGAPGDVLRPAGAGCGRRDPAAGRHGGLLGGWLAGTAGVTATLLGSAVSYLLITLAPFVFPAWAGMDRPPPVDSLAEPAGMTSADG